MKKKLLLFLLFAVPCHSILAQWENLNLNQNVLSVFKSGITTFAGTEKGLYYKKDNEANWQQYTGFTTRVKSFIKENNTLYLSSYQRVFKSTDLGLSWQPLKIVREYEDVNNVFISGNTLIAAMDGGGIYFSADDGANWYQSGTSWQSHNTALIKKGDNLYLSTKNSGFMQRSTDDTGRIWTSINGDGLKIGLSSAFQDITSLASINDDVLIAGTNDYSTAVGQDGVYFSYDNGAKFVKRIYGMTNPSINALAVVGNLIFAGSENGGVYYSKNEGNDWFSLNTGLANLNISKLYVFETELYAATSTGVFKIDICNLLKNTSKIYSDGNVVISKGKTLELKANSGGKSYNWYKNDVLINDVHISNFIVTESGEYKVTVIYSSACNDESNKVNVTVETLGLEDLTDVKNKIKLYPNPIVDFLSIENDNKDIKSIKILDVNGKVLSDKINIDNEMIKINFTSYPKGIYFIQINSDHKSIRKVIKI